MFDLSTPWQEAAWYDLATVHFGVSVVLGALIGYILKILIDGLIKHVAKRRAAAVEEFEDMIEEMAWQRAAQYAEPVEFKNQEVTAGRKKIATRETLAIAA